MAANASLFYPLLRYGKPLAFAANHVGRRNPHVLKKNLTWRIAHHGWPQALKRYTRGLHIHNKTAHSAPGALLWVGDRDHLRVVRVLSASYETFGAVDHVMISVFDSPRFHACGIAPRIGLRLRETDFLLT